MDKFFKELRRRNVFRVAGVYAVVGWLLIQVIVAVKAPLHLPAWTDTFFVVLVLAGFPISLILAWAFEMTPEGMRPTASVAEGESITAKTGKKLDYAILIGLALVAVIVVADRVMPKSAPETQVATDTAPAIAEPAGDATTTTAIDEKSVAVLPFIALSSGEDDGFFADGMTEELLNSLAAVPDLLVTARTSSFYFKDKDIPIDEIAARLGVAHVVEGSVRRAGDQLRITAQLIRARDGFHMWSQTYDRPLAHVFTVQTEIAENIAGALSIYLDDKQRAEIDRSGTHNVEAFKAYLKGVDLYRRSHALEPGVSLWDANKYFAQAMALDPKYVAPAIAHHDAYAHILLDGPGGKYTGHTEGEPEISQEEARTRLLADLDRAIANARSPTMRLIAEINKEFFSPDWSRMPGLVAQFKKEGSIEEVVTAESVWLVNILSVFGDFDLLQALSEHGMKINPLDINPWDEAIVLKIIDGDFDAARTLIKKARETAGDHIWLRSDEADIAAFEGDKDLLIDLLKYPEKDAMTAALNTAYRVAIEGDYEEATRLAEKIDAESGWPIPNLLFVYIETGDKERARALTQRIDALPAGPTILCRSISLFYNRLVFDVNDAPNLKARLKEADIDPTIFKPYPRVSGGDVTAAQ